jgi:sulfhydrogenase subunit gamma (sulfur reductase)
MSELLECTPMTDLPVAAVVRGARLLTAREILLDLELEGGRELRHQPGQFVMVSLMGTGEAPISISSPPRPGGRFELCVRDAGTLTHYLHRLKESDRVGIRGPFGHGFPQDEIEGYDVVLVAGGLGLAPLRSLISTVVQRRERFGKVTIMYGARSPRERLFVDELERWARSPGVRVAQTVDVADGTWRGRVGVITTLFSGLEFDPHTSVAAICGPPVMYKFVVMELLARGFLEGRIYMSLERRMCCGMGKCGQCQINGEFVCRSGPVYRYLDAKRLREAL